MRSDTGGGRRGVGASSSSSSSFERREALARLKPRLSLRGLGKEAKTRVALKAVRKAEPSGKRHPFRSLCGSRAINALSFVPSVLNRFFNVYLGLADSA